MMDGTERENVWPIVLAGDGGVRTNRIYPVSARLREIEIVLYLRRLSLHVPA